LHFLFAYSHYAFTESITKLVQYYQLVDIIVLIVYQIVETNI